MAKTTCHKGSKCHAAIAGVSVNKEARFKVDEKVKVMWKQRSPAKVFCSHCGDPFLKCKCDQRGIAPALRKIVGIVEVTDVFKIDMMKWNDEFRLDPHDDMPMIHNKTEYIIAEFDGFKSADDMFKWFDKKYDLSQPKPFWVYRWCWLEG